MPKSKKTSSSDQKTIQKIISELLKLLEIDGTFDVVSASKTEELEELEIVLDTKDSGIVIGYHGEILEALQFVISLCVSKKLGRFVRVSIEVGDYKKNRIEFLNSLALQTKEKVLEENREFSLSNLKSWERRIVHLALQEDDKVITESMGEGKERTLVIKPK